jgi:hypothetical protein
MENNVDSKETDLEYLNLYLTELANANRLTIDRKLILLETFIKAFKKRVNIIS